MTDRRAFLFGLAGAASLVAAPQVFASRVPLLWGDGVHDDTEALNALFSGKPVKLGETQDTFRPLFGKDGDGLILSGGHYLVSGPVVISVPRATWANVNLISPPGSRGGLSIEAPGVVLKGGDSPQVPSGSDTTSSVTV